MGASDQSEYTRAHQCWVYGAIAGLIGFWFAIRSLTTLVVVDVFGMDAPAGAVLRLMLTYGGFAGVWVLTLADAKPIEARIARQPSIKWVFFFLAVSGCSFLWSAAPSVAASGAYWLGTACDLGIILLLLRGVAAREVAASVMKGFVVGALIVAAVSWMMPTEYDLRLGDETYFNANTIAYICSFGVFFAQFLMRCKPGRWIVIAIFLVATILRSLSKTTIVAFCIAEAFLLIQDRSMKRRTKVAVAISGLLLIVVFSGLFMAYFDAYTRYGNQAETLTGRTAIWAWAVNEALQRPLLGHGFDSMWNVAPWFGTFEARHAENEVLQQFYAFGAVGVMILLGAYLSLWRMVRRAAQEPRRAILASIILFVAIRGLAEAEPFDLLLPLWMIVLITVLVTPTLPQGEEGAPAVVPVILGAPNVTAL